MWEQYLRPVPPPVVDGAPCAVIVDLDGTLARMEGRGPYDWDRVGEDALDPVVAGMVDTAQRQDCRVLIVSGREDVCRDTTTDWLRRHNIAYSGLWMRAAGDHRPDRDVKADLYRDHIEGKYNIRYVLDDRDSVVAFWRSKGLKVLQCEYGSF
jgi:hypothetical protein